MTFPTYIERAVELGLLIAEDGKIVGCKKDEVETVMGMARLIEKIQPTTAEEEASTTDQEAIVICRVLNSPSGKAHELWGELRIAFGVGHGQQIPDNLWSPGALRAIGREIDRTFMGERNSSLISRENLITSFAGLAEGSRLVGIAEFNKTICELSDSDRMSDYGDASSEWNVALDLLRQQRVRAIYTETQSAAMQAEKAKGKLEVQIEFQQSRLMECLGMLRGSVGNQGNAVDAVEQLLAPQKAGVSIIDRMMESRQGEPPVSTGILAMDIDMEGGVRRPGQEQGGRIFTLGARTGVGKSILGVHAAVNLVMNGLVVGFISAEMDEGDISARIWSAATRHLDNTSWVKVGSINDPNQNRDRDAALIAEAATRMQAANGKLLLECPWGADVDAVVNSLRSMKAKNPTLRAAVIDHFHCLGRHKGAPSNDASMLEERAYKLMTVAKELSIDLIVLAQLNRTGMGNDVTATKPDETWIRGTDALAHISHAVWVVRREKQDDDVERTERKLEFWHTKTRGSQKTTIDGSSRVVKGFVEKSTLGMDYAYSSVKSDDTKAFI